MGLLIYDMKRDANHTEVSLDNVTELLERIRGITDNITQKSTPQLNHIGMLSCDMACKMFMQLGSYACIRRLLFGNAIGLALQQTDSLHE